MKNKEWKTSIRLFRNFGLKRKALGIFLLFIIFPTFGVGVIVQYQFNQVLRDQFVSSTRRNLDTVTSQLEEQTKMVEDFADYMILNPDMREFLRVYPPPTPAQTENRKQNIEGFLTFQLISKSYIKSITIAGFNGNTIQMGEPFSGNENDWLYLADARKGGIVWSNDYTLHSEWYGETHLISMFRVLNSYDEITRPLGRLTIRLDEANMMQLLEKGISPDMGYVWIMNDQGQAVLRPERIPAEWINDPEWMQTIIAQQGDRVTYPVLEGKDYLAFSSAIESTDWHIVALIPERTVKEQFKGITWTMAIILIGILLLGITALIGFQYTIIRPILRLKKETNRVSRGDFSARVPIQSRDEIAELNRKFNEMVSTIQELIDHKYKLELHERESELKLLQNQVDPHFLYNTLDMIRWTARLEKATRSSQLIEMLSKFFRSSINNGQYHSTIVKELEFVRTYLYLHQHRLGGKLTYILYTEADIGQTLLLKATIQPLVENYMKHGLDRQKRNHQITVRCYRVDEDIWIDVIDNGKGMSSARLQEIESSLMNHSRSDDRGGAMNNIHDRISLFFGKTYGLSIIESTSAGTWVRIRIPARLNNQESGERYE